MLRSLLMVLAFNVLTYVKWTNGQGTCGPVLPGICGWNITEGNCVKRGCCYDASLPDVERCVYPMMYFNNPLKVVKIYQGRSRLNINDNSNLLAYNFMKNRIESEVEQAFRYNFPQVQFVKVQNFTGPVFEYTITLVCNVTDSVDEMQLLQSYSSAIGRMENRIANGHYFVGDPLIKDFNECDTGNVCGYPSKCINTPGSYRCECMPAFTKNASGGCDDIDECVDTSVCRSDQDCINTVGSYSCFCKRGFESNSNRTSCVDIDECATGADNCDKNPDQICENTLGGFVCKCRPGFFSFTFDKKDLCLDINECKRGAPCRSSAVCENTRGSYKCRCTDGQVVDPTFQCPCPIGFAGDGLKCADIDECTTPLTNNCNSNAQCTNTEGSFTCGCHAGYQGDGVTSCTDVDECAMNTCDANANCTNTQGSYNCTCRSGFEEIVGADGTIGCVDMNECELLTYYCHVDAICENIIGSYKCSCASGYIGDGVNSCDSVGRSIDNSNNKKGEYCHPISGPAITNSLAGTVTCSAGATCELGDNKQYFCRCIEGLGGNGAKSCYDIDECADLTHSCHAWANCNNTEGSYTCECLDGYSGDGEDCDDIDECESDLHSCQANASCMNTRGSYKCSCDDGFLKYLSSCEKLTTFFGVVALNSSYMLAPGLKNLTDQTLAKTIADELLQMYRWDLYDVFDTIVMSFTRGSIVAEHVIAAIGINATQLTDSFEKGINASPSSAFSGAPWFIKKLETPIENLTFVGSSATGILLTEELPEASKTFSSSIVLNPIVIGEYASLMEGKVTNSTSSAGEDFSDKLERELLQMFGLENEFFFEVDVTSVVSAKEALANLTNEVNQVGVKYFKASAFVKDLSRVPELKTRYFQSAATDAVSKLTRGYSYLLSNRTTSSNDSDKTEEIEFDSDGPIRVGLVQFRLATAEELATVMGKNKPKIVAEHLIAILQDKIQLPGSGKDQQIDVAFLKSSFESSQSKDGVRSKPWGFVPVIPADGVKQFQTSLFQQWNITSPSDIADNLLIGRYDVTIEGESGVTKIGEMELFNFFQNSLDMKIVSEEKASFSGLPLELFMESCEIEYEKEDPKKAENGTNKMKENSTEVDKDVSVTFNASVATTNPYSMATADPSDPNYDRTVQLLGSQLQRAYKSGLEGLETDMTEWEVDDVTVKIVGFREVASNSLISWMSLIANFEIVINGTNSDKITKEVLDKAYQFALQNGSFEKNLFASKPWNFKLVNVQVEEEVEATTHFSQRTTTQPTSVPSTLPSTGTVGSGVTTNLPALRTTALPTGRITSGPAPTTLSPNPSYILTTLNALTTAVTQYPTLATTSDITSAFLYLLKAPMMTPTEIERAAAALTPYSRSLLWAIVSSPESKQYLPYFTIVFLTLALKK